MTSPPCRGPGHPRTDRHRRLHLVHQHRPAPATGAAAGATVAVGAGGIAHPSSDETLTSSGGSFKAVYSGDANYTGSTGACEPLTASKLDELDRDRHPPRHQRARATPRAAPAITSAPIGSTVHDMATVSWARAPAPTGTVAFTWYTNTRPAPAPASPPAPGPWPWARAASPTRAVTRPSPARGGSFKAVYSGDANYTGSTGDCEPLTATKVDELDRDRHPRSAAELRRRATPAAVAPAITSARDRLDRP